MDRFNSEIVYSDGELIIVKIADPDQYRCSLCAFYVDQIKCRNSYTNICYCGDSLKNTIYFQKYEKI